MPDEPSSPAQSPGVPARQPPLERAALERVLARAAELQSRESDPGEPTLSEQQLIEIGKEVGLSPQHLRQALAEERTRVAVPEEPSAMARVFGAAAVRATRTIRGTPAALLEALDAWMQLEESLQVRRRFPERMLWEPRSGFAAEFRRMINVGGRGYHLSRAEEIAATVIAVDAERSVVRLDASLANVRLQRIASGGVVAAGGALTTGTLVALGFAAPFAVVPAVAFLAGGWLVARSHAPLVARAQLALEQVLDRLERGETPKPSLLAALSATTRGFR